jgi:hypothetical protein
VKITNKTFGLDLLQFFDGSPVKSVEFVLILDHNPTQLTEMGSQDRASLNPCSLEAFRIKPCFLDVIFEQIDRQSVCDLCNISEVPVIPSHIPNPPFSALKMFFARLD